MSKRPWKVRWWSNEWYDYIGASYSTRERALERGKKERDEGADSISIWQNDEKGYVVSGTLEYLENLPYWRRYE